MRNRGCADIDGRSGEGKKKKKGDCKKRADIEDMMSPWMLILYVGVVILEDLALAQRCGYFMDRSVAPSMPDPE